MTAEAKVANLTEGEFDARASQATALIQDWGDRECTSFDDAVRRASGEATAATGGSIWDMPTIDSKRVVSLLTELEPVLERRLPPSLIKSGGYSSVAELQADLLPKLKVFATRGKAKPLPSTNPAPPSSAAPSPPPA